MEPSISLLYSGEVSISFGAGHRYTITDNGITLPRCPSVTTVCSILDKPALIPWAVNSALSICSGAIVPDTPYGEIHLETIWKTARESFRTVKAEAANIGTEVHQFLEGYLRSTPLERPLLPPEDTPSGLAVRAALDWLDTISIQPIALERRVYSRRHRYVGTLDKLAIVEGKLSLIDWKTSTGLYPEFRLQTAAYQGAYEEETGERIEQRILVRLDKLTGIPEPHTFTRGEYHKDHAAFIAAKKLYTRIKEIS